MKKADIQDERIIFQKRKIGSDAFGIVYIGLIVSILVQQFVYDAPFKQYAAEFILFMAAAVYVVVRNITVGHNLFGESGTGQKMVIINSLVCGITISAVTTTLNSISYGMDKMGGISGIALVGLITFISGALVSFIGFQSLHIMNRKRQKQLEDKLTNDADE